MGYHVVSPAALDATPDYPCDRRSVTEAAELAGLAAAVYELAPGEALAHEYHYHERREEVFYVVSGDLHVETPDGEYVAGSGEVFVAEPESPLYPHCPPDADAGVRVFGVGAPRSDPGLPYGPDADADDSGADAGDGG